MVTKSTLLGVGKGNSRLVQQQIYWRDGRGDFVRWIEGFSLKYTKCPTASWEYSLQMLRDSKRNIYPNLGTLDFRNYILSSSGRQAEMFTEVWRSGEFSKCSIKLVNIRTDAFNMKPRWTFYSNLWTFEPTRFEPWNLAELFIQTVDIRTDALIMKPRLTFNQTCEHSNRRFQHETSLNFLFKLVNRRFEHETSLNF